VTTYAKQFQSAMACATVDEADIWMKKEIGRYVSVYGYAPEQARHVILSNFGYIARDYDQETSQKVFELFGAVHPGARFASDDVE
jgi:hypothetical protein